ncbi:MAG: DNA polymerase III subunit delta [Candidatus Omnitrophica bacterium]|nr:DNA polymerase III subunit delta [Candidatus Omnitrophota bacterium]
MVRSLTYWDIKGEIDADKIGGKYLFYGEEQFLKRAIENQLKTRLIPQAYLHFNYDVFFCGETDYKAILESLNVKPVKSPRRLVIIKDAEKLKISEKEFIEFLKSSKFDTTCLILETAKGENDGFIKKLFPLLTPVKFSRLVGPDLGRWVTKYLDARGKKIAFDAMGLLVENAGSELTGLSQDLDKLILYAGEAKQISRDHVEKIVTKTSVDSRFDFVNALMRKDAARALALLEQINRGGKNVAEIIGLINWQLKRVENVKRLEDVDCSNEDIKRELKLNPYALEILKKQAKKIRQEWLDKSFRLLLSSDMDIKQGRQEPLLALQTLVVTLCSDSR